MRVKISWNDKAVLLSRRTTEQVLKEGSDFPPEGDLFRHPPEFAQLDELRDLLEDAGMDCGLSDLWDFLQAWLTTPFTSCTVRAPSGLEVRLEVIDH